MPDAHRQELGAWLLEAGAVGVEERDEATRPPGPGPGRVTLVATFASLAEARRAAAELHEQQPELDSRVGELVGDDWREAYKEHFAPFRLTSRLVVAPPWRSYTPGRRDELVLQLDPGRAYGTGLHASTQLAAAHLEHHAGELEGGALLDVGTGSGILALAGLLLGCRRAVAIDNDPSVIEVARRNAELNGLGGRLTVSCCSVEQLTGQGFPVVIANLDRRTLQAVGEPLVATVDGGGLLILGGILQPERDEVLSQLTGGVPELRCEHCSEQGDGEDRWVSLSLRRIAGPQ